MKYDLVEEMKSRKKWREGFEDGTDVVLFLVDDMIREIAKSEEDLAETIHDNFLSYFEKIKDYYREAKRLGYKKTI